MSRPLDPERDSFGTLRAYTPGYYETARNWVYDNVVRPVYGVNADQKMRDIETVTGFLPGVGDAMSGAQAVDAARSGQWGTAGLLGAATLVGTIPGAGDAVAGGLKKAGGLLRMGKRAGGRGISEVAERVLKTPALRGQMDDIARGAARAFDPDKMARQYPDVAPPVWAVDKKTGKKFLQKALSPEADAVAKARAAAQKAVDAGDYVPHFDVSQRTYVDPANYPLQGNTMTDALPKKQETIGKWTKELATPEAGARLQAGYDAAKNDPLARDWYAMAQLEKAYVEELGPEAGRQAYKRDFADAMAATTGGADPTSNLMMAHYGNFLRNQGASPPANAYDMPFPVGGRYVSGNMEQYDKFLNRDVPLTAADNPKRFDFSANFQGHLDRATIDEQMSRGIKPGMNIPPGDTYGIAEKIVHDLAAVNGVQPANFQDVAWAGLKGERGKPMIQHVNEMLERTSRITGKPVSEVLRGYINKSMPMYSLGALLLADQVRPREDNRTGGSF